MSALEWHEALAKTRAAGRQSAPATAPATDPVAGLVALFGGLDAVGPRTGAAERPPSLAQEPEHLAVSAGRVRARFLGGTQVALPGSISIFRHGHTPAQAAEARCPPAARPKFGPPPPPEPRVPAPPPELFSVTKPARI
jgi:hypothetical protein